jgi:hypothetical protein
VPLITNPTAAAKVERVKICFVFILFTRKVVRHFKLTRCIGDNRSTRARSEGRYAIPPMLDMLASAPGA